MRNSGSDRSSAGLTWARLRRDRWSVGALCVVAAIVFASFAGGPTASRILGHNGYDQFPYSANISQKPVGPWTRVPALETGLGNTADGELTPPPAGTKTTLFVFGADGPLAALRVLTMIGMEIGTAIGVSIYIESTFHLNGLASSAVFAMAGNGAALDLPFILALVFLISAIVVVGNLAVDAFYVFCDPRAALGGDHAPTTKVAASGVI